MRGDRPEVELGEAFLRAVIDEVAQGTVLLSAEGEVVWASRGAERLTAASVEQLVGRPFTDFLDADDRAAALEAYQAVVGGAGPGTTTRAFELTLSRPDGVVRSVDAVSRNLLDHPDVGGIVVTLSDVTGRALVDRVLAAVMRGALIDEQLEILVELMREQVGVPLAAVAFGLRDGVLTEAVGPGLPISLCGVGMSVVPGWAADPEPWASAMRHRSVASYLGVPDLDEDARRAATSLGMAACWVEPVLLPGGELAGCLTCWSELAAAPTPAQRVALTRIARLAAFSLERSRYEERLVHAARHDALTGLPNRDQFFARLRLEVTRADMTASQVGVLYLDLDGFKAVNDTFGHSVGDKVLEVVGQRVRRVIRPTDVVARLGGDEFAVVCPQVNGEAESIAIAERVIGVVSQPIGVGSVTAEVGASIGIALGPADSAEPDVLVNLADGALYRAKQAGKGRWARCEGPPTRDTFGS